MHTFLKTYIIMIPWLYIYRFRRLSAVHFTFGRGRRIFRHRSNKRYYPNDSRVRSWNVRIGSTQRQSVVGNGQILWSAHSSKCTLYKYTYMHTYAHNIIIMYLNNLLLHSKHYVCVCKYIRSMYVYVSSYFFSGSTHTRRPFNERERERDQL